MICSKCGSEIEDEKLFCPICGNEIKLVAEYDILDDIIINNNSIFINQIYDDKKNQDVQQQKIYPKIQANIRNKSFLSSLIGKKKVCLSIIATFIISILSFIMIVSNNNANSFEYQINKAYKYYKADDCNMAIKKVHQALKLKENDENARSLEADIYIKLGDFENAKLSYMVAIKNNPKNIEYYDKLFDILQKNKAYNEIKSIINSSIIKDALKRKYSLFYPSKPNITKMDGEYEEPFNIDILSDENNIYYTLDGTIPSEKSYKYKKPIQIKDEGDYTLKAISINNLHIKSDIITKNYSLYFTIPKAPNIMLGTGRYDENTLIKIVADEDCEIYYNWDGAIPDTNDSKYILPIKIKEGSHTFTAVAINKYGKVSEPTVRSYDVYTTDEENEDNE